MEVYYDADHPSVYVHTRNPNEQVSSVNNASQVLLLPSTQVHCTCCPCVTLSVLSKEHQISVHDLLLSVAVRIVSSVV